ncbi:Hpt domain-containing protein [Vibrio sp. 404]|uniref:Hpt domain-containing protein n=1 Tax=Vibrio marinisediminis TaxID=2758441 RepID=A0A7W2FPP1_9VIBR|nr:Hpt domain-containing protein [Vibrio marinisediminis]MBA5761973.1 Hpt domain-containing protein [Vibrio marinisediminis]
MDKRQLKLGWWLIMLWLVGMSVMIFNYHQIERRVQQVELLGDCIEEFRSRLYFDMPYRTYLSDQQTKQLEGITTLRAQLEQSPPFSWLQPDIQQLLFTTDRFIEQSRAFMSTELAIKDLIISIQDKRQQYDERSEMAVYYYQLSAYVFEALFSSQSSSSMAYRELDKLYTQSLLINEQEKQHLQQSLAETSSVMGSFAQGTYLVEQLIGHSIHDEIRKVEAQFHHALEKLLIFSLVISGILMTFIMSFYQRAMIRVSKLNLSELNTSKLSASKALSPHDEQPKTVEPTDELSSLRSVEEETEAASAEVSVEQQVNFEAMLESLGDDKESLCMLLEVFVADHKDDVAQITQLLNDSPDEAIRKAHSLKGVGGNLGADQLRDSASKLEIAIVQDITQVAALLPELDRCLNKAIEEAELFIEQHSCNEES